MRLSTFLHNHQNFSTDSCRRLIKMITFNFLTVVTRVGLSASHPVVPSLRTARLTARQFSVTFNRSSHVGSKPIDIPADVSLSFSYPVRPRTSNSSIPYGQPQISVKGKLGRLDIDVLRFVTFTFQSPTCNQVLGSGLSPPPLTSPRTFASQEPPPVPQDTVSGPGVLQILVDDSAQKKQRGIWGLTRALVANAVQGVTEGFTSSLELVGVGYRASLEDVPPDPNEPTDAKPKQRLNLRVGYSHPVLINLPDSDTFLCCEVPSSNQILLKGIDKQELGVMGAGIRKWRPPEPYSAFCKVQIHLT